MPIKELLKTAGGIRPSTTRLVFGTVAITGIAVAAGAAVASGVVKFPVNPCTGADVGTAAGGAVVVSSSSPEQAAKTAIKAINPTSNKILLLKNKPVILPS
jgi:hypothetical protein